MTRIGLVTGLRFEADILTRQAVKADPSLSYDIEASGPGYARAYETACAMVDRGADMLISMGLAGGLDGRLKAGDIVLADRVLDGAGQDFATADMTRKRLLAHLQTQDLMGAGVYSGPLYGALDPVTNIGAKKALHEKTGVLAVDMESHAVGRAAREAGIPFLVLRVISDERNQVIPKSALAGMKADGSVSPWPVILCLIKNPGDIPGLLKLGRQSAIAKKILARLGHCVFRSRL